MTDAADTAPARARRYSTVAVVLHWVIAAAILLQIILAGRMEGPASPKVFAVFQLHKSVGITILLLSLVRLGWRLVNPPPPESYHLARWERVLSQITHWGFYVIMIGMPLTGWLMVSASKLAIPTLLYGVVPWPDLPGFAGMAEGAKHAWHEFGEVGHDVLAKVVWGLLALHVAGALKHHLFSPGEPVLGRMVPGVVHGRWFEPRLLLIVLGALGVIVFGRLVTPPSAHTAAPPAAASEATEPEAAAAPAAEPDAAAPATPAATEDPAAPEAAALAAPAGPAKPAAEPVKWAVAPGSVLSFSTSWGGEPIEGRFKAWSGDILFSPEALDASKVSISIDLTSADTGDAQRDSSLASSDWFDASSYPKATYVADRFLARGGDRYVAKGRLTLRGVSKPLDLPFELKIDGDKARVRGVTTLDRTAFGVGQGDWKSTDQIPAGVKVSVDLKATKR